jgi:hypothetical protein
MLAAYRELQAVVSNNIADAVTVGDDGSESEKPVVSEANREKGWDEG